MDHSAIPDIQPPHHWWDRVRRLTRLALPRAGGLLMLAAVAVVLGIAIDQTMAARNEVASAVQQTLRGLDAAMMEQFSYAAALTEARAFLTDHSIDSRRRFESAAHDAEAKVGRLRDMLIGEPGRQQALADNLSSLVGASLLLLHEALDHADLRVAAPVPAPGATGGVDSARPTAVEAEDPAQAARLQRGWGMADAVAIAAEALRADQRQTLAQRTDAIDRSLSEMLTTLSLGVVCLVVGAALATLVRVRESRQLRRLHGINATLEDCLGRRTTALHTSEAKLHSYLTHLADGLSVIRVERDGRFVYQDINAAARTILALGDENVIGLAPHEVYREGDRAAVEDRLRECLHAETLIRYNKVIVTPAGRRELRVSLAPVRGAPDAEHPRGRIELLLHSMRDVTGETEREERLRQSQRVEAVGRLTAGVAHDFNNLLQALMGGLELAMADVEDRPEATESINTALQAARRGALLTSQLLSFSRQQILRPVAVDITQQLHDLANALDRTLGQDIHVNVVGAPDLPPAYVDPTHLSAALFNLALNARDAMPSGGTLQIEAFPVGDELVVVVSDTGTGMAPEVLERACEPFFTTKGIASTGLGLSMVHGFARQSGGDLRITSNPGQGTRVEIALLPAPVAAIASTPGGAATLTRGVGRVLLVDDEADVRQVTSAFLRKAGFEVMEARDADAALAVLASGRTFDALVTDYAMPGMNGVDLVMQAREAAAGLPALIITGYAGAEGLRWLPPDVVVLRKPFKRASFVQAVTELIEAANQGSDDNLLAELSVVHPGLITGAEADAIVGETLHT